MKKNEIICEECGCVKTALMICSKPHHSDKIDEEEFFSCETKNKPCCHCVEYSYGFSLL